MNRIAETAVVYPGVELGEDVVIGDYAVVGKQPVLGKRSTASRGELPPLVVGDGSAILAGAVVFAGTTLGAGVIVGDQACVRERCELGDEVVIGRGSHVENDTSIGARTRVQANAYVTAYSTLEEDVFIAPCVVTTNDNYMGRTETAPAPRCAARPFAAEHGSAAAPSYSRAWRSARRRSSAPARSSSTTCLRGRWSSGIRRGRSATCPTTSSSADDQLKLNAPVEPGTSPVEDGGASRAR